MTDEEIQAALARRSFLELFLRHDRIRTDVRAAQFGVVVVMMVMRTAPNAAGAEKQNSDDTHQTFRHPRFRQDRVVLLIVIDHEQSQHQQPGEHAARDLRDPMDIPNRSCHSYEKERERREHMPPTPTRYIVSKGFGRENQFCAGSDVRRIA